MHLTRIRVEHWRCHHELELADLPPGAVLVAGPNESGKSSLVEALHYALFEQVAGAGAVRRDLVPAGTREAPRVEVDLALGDALWTVRKRFVQGPACSLDGPGQHLEADEAEARLQELLGIDIGRRGRITGEVDADLLRFWPALWLRQDRHGDLGALLTEGVRTSLGEAIAAEVGDLTVDERVAGLRTRVAAEAERYWTPTGKETGELREARRAVAVARAEQDTARAAHARAEDILAELSACAERRIGLDQRLVAARTRRAQLAERERAVTELRHELAEAERAEREAAAAAETAARQRAERRELAARVAGLAPRRRAAVEAEGVAEAAQRQTERLAETARSARDAAEAAHDRARSALRCAEGRREAAALRAEDARLAKTLDDLEELQARRRELAAERVALPGLDDAALAALEAAERALADARLVRDAAAVQVELRAEGACRPIWDDEDPEDLAAGATSARRIVRPVRLRLPGVAELRLVPGSDELRDRQETVASAERDLARALAGHNLPDLDAARATRRRLVALDAQLAALDQRRADRAPDGIEALRARREEIAARLAAADDEADAGGSGPDAGGSGPDAAATDPAAAVQAAAASATDSERVRAEARSALDGAEGDLREAREALTARRQERHELEREAAGLEARLGGLPAADELDATVAERERELTAARGTATALREELAAAGAEAVTAELTAVADQVQGFERELADLATRQAGLDGELRSTLSADPHARLQEAEAEAERSAAALAAVVARAAAARSLLDAIEAVLQETRAELARPVLGKVAPYLARVFPERTVDLDAETWEVAGLVGEPVDRLSVGAREQFALLVRLGLAEVFAADARLPLVLDDPLVNADPERRRALLGALRHAARNLQLLLFTCHEADHDELYPDRRIVLTETG